MTQSKTFTSIHEVAIEDLRRLLQKWENKDVTFVDVQAWAEQITLTGLVKYENDNPRSLLVEIISWMNIMYAYPILRQDAPILLHILDLAQVSPEEAWEALDIYYDSVDWQGRSERAHQNFEKYHDHKYDDMTDP